MGGLVAVTVRTEEEELIKSYIHTSMLNYLFNNYKFFEKDKKHIELIKEILIKNDTPKIGLYPEEYGLILIDLKTNTLLSEQSFTSFGDMYFLSACSFVGCIINDKVDINDTPNYKLISDLYNKGYITKYIDSLKEIEIDLPKFKNIEDFMTFVENKERLAQPDKKGYSFSFRFYLKINTTWNIETYDSLSRVEAIKKLKKDTINLGLEITKEENIKWEEYLNYIT